MLEARNLSKSYNGHAALTDLNLKIEPGEVFCLLGANGAGKTTTINLFLNFIQPSGGRALIKGLDVVQQPLETKKHLACIPEQVMHIAGTGTARHRHFTALVDEYHREWRAYFVPLIFQRARISDHASLPAFRYREEPAGDVAGRVLTGAALALPAALLAFAGVRRLRRFPVA